MPLFMFLTPVFFQVKIIHTSDITENNDKV